MEIVSTLLRRGLRLHLHFLALTALGWAVYFRAVGAPGGVFFFRAAIFALGATIISFYVLKALGYFGPFRLVPRKIDLVLLMVAFLVGGVAQYSIHRVIFDAPLCIDCSLSSVLLWTPILSVFVFTNYYLFSVALLKLGRTVKMVLEVLPAERAALLEDLTRMEIDDYFEFLSKTDLRKLINRGRANVVDVVVLSRGAVGTLEQDPTLLRAHLEGINFMDFVEASVNLTGRVRIADTDVWSFLNASTPQTPLVRGCSKLKTMSEPLIALTLLLLFAPIMAIIAIVIRSTSRGPVFYVQRRTGYLGREFDLIKFRSMALDAEAAGPQWASTNDPRVTPVGRFIRKTRLDELPQLFNVIRGEMGFFGPRPERPEIYRQLEKDIPLFSLRTIVRPGITGWAQVCAGYAASVAESKTKLEYDLYYIQKTSPYLDLIILFKTVYVALFGDKVARKNVVVDAPVAVKTS